jgi:integrase
VASADFHIRLRSRFDHTRGRNRRRVPITAILRDYLVENRMATGRDEGFVFGRSATDPFKPERVTARADAAWKAAGLDRITLHACRHTFASLMIAAGVNAKGASVLHGALLDSGHVRSLRSLDAG